MEISPDLYEDVNYFETESEVNEAIAVIFVKVYCYVNIELKLEVVHEEYSDKYPDYDVIIRKSTAFLNDARKHLKVAKNDLIEIGDS